MSTDFGDVICPIARKDYKCEWCGETIVSEVNVIRPLRIRHVKFVGKWNGEFQSWRMHAECYSVSDDNDELEDGFMPYEHARGGK